jgi:hypothetical protein
MLSEIFRHGHVNSIKNTGDKTLHLALDIRNNHETLIFKSLGIPIIHGFRYAVGEFCKQLEKKSGIATLIIGSSNSNEAIFPKIKLDDNINRTLLEYFDNENSKTIVSEFEPDCLPLIIAQDQDVLLKKRIESDKADKQIGAAALMMARQFTETMEVECEQYQFINYSNSLIKNFHSFDKSRQNAVAGIVISIATLLSANDTIEKITMFELLNAQLQLLATQA